MLCFTNCQACVAGELIQQDIYFSPESQTISPNYYYRTEGVERIDLGGAIVAPGFLELQTNGLQGVHFSQLGQKDDEQKLLQVARREVQAGVTAFWATLPTVDETQWKVILPSLSPRSFPQAASLLGAHCEGPYLHPSKMGAHNETFFRKPTLTSPESLYGSTNLETTIKLITLAPELPGSVALIGHLRETYPHLAISLGHSSATYDEGLAALAVGASALTHVFNAMAPLHHREPGLPGLMASGRCYYSIIPDGIHLHAAALTIALRTDAAKCILITDSIELAGLPDGVHPGHGQIPHPQRKIGNHVTIEGTDTLVGSCCTLDECVRNMVSLTGCNLAEAVRCVTENVAQMMGESKRGVLEPGRRADFVVLTSEGYVKETWIGGERVWVAGEGGSRSEEA